MTRPRFTLRWMMILVAASGVVLVSLEGSSETQKWATALLQEREMRRVSALHETRNPAEANAFRVHAEDAARVAAGHSPGLTVLYCQGLILLGLAAAVFGIVLHFVRRVLPQAASAPSDPAPIAQGRLGREGPAFPESRVG